MKENIYNLVELLDKNAFRFSKRTALIFGAKKVSYGQLSIISKKLASALHDLGVRKSDRVALWLPNCTEFVYSFFAVLRLGAIVVPVNTMFKREEANGIVDDSQAKVLICSIDKADDCGNILSRLDTLQYLISLPAPVNGKEVILDFNKLINKNKEFSRDVKIGTEDLAEIVYTSGTTGRPKGACLSHRNLISNVRDCSKVINIGKRDCFICILPLFHSFASTVCMLLPLYNGSRIVIMRAVKPFKRVSRAIFKHKVTIFAGVPSIYNILSEAKIPRLKLFLNIFLNPIRIYISGAAALPLSVCNKFEKKFKRPLLQGYGLTEASPVVSLNSLKNRRNPDSIGKSLPSVEVKIVDKNSSEVTEGEVGELLVKGLNVMRGYYNLPEETKKVLKDGWLYTGDLAKKDKEGFLYIMGRSKEMINVRGFNVYPKEIEDVLYQYPKIKEAAVVGVSHRHRGEVPVAFVVKDGVLEQKEVLDYVKANIASYKVPLKVLFKDNLPKNPTGKILKRELQEEVKNIFV